MQEQKNNKQPVFEPFNEVGAQIMVELNQRHNEYAALRKQEEELQQNRRNLLSVIHDLKTESKFKISDILIPFGKGFVQLRASNKNDIIKQHYDALNTLDTQIKSIEGQRQHRGDELGAALMRATRFLWSQLRTKYKYTDAELLEQITQLTYTPKDNMKLETIFDNIAEE